MTAVTIQSNKIVSSEVKNNEVLLEPSYRKKMNFLSNPIYHYSLNISLLTFFCTVSQLYMCVCTHVGLQVQCECVCVCVSGAARSFQ